MPNPSTRWDRVPVFGVWLKVDDTPSPGKIAFGVGQRVTRVDGREIYPEGAQLEVTIGKQDEQDAAVRSTVRAAWRAADAAAAGGSFDAVAWDTRWDTVIVPAAIFARFPAADDPDIVQSGYTVTVSERLASGKGKSYSIQPLLSQLDLPVPGINLGLVEVPPDATSTPAPVYAKGVPGGVAALDVNGNVINADGVVLLPAGEPAAGSVTNTTISPTAAIELTKTVDAGDRFAMTSAERAKIADAALANQVVPVGRTVTAGEGLQGGGDLGADRTLSVRFGTAYNMAVRGNDSRLSDARPPIAHDASLITSGLVAPARLGTGTASSETVLYGDGVFRPPSGGSGGSSAVYYSAPTGWPARPDGSGPVTWVDPTGTAPAPPALGGDLVYVAGSAAPSTGVVQLLPAAVRDLDSGWWNQTTSAQVSGGTITLSGATVVQWGCADILVKPNTFYQMNAYPSSGTGTYTMEAVVTASAGNQYPYVTGRSGVGTLTFTTGPTATVAKFFVKGEANQTVTLTQIRVYEG